MNILRIFCYIHYKIARDKANGNKSPLGRLQKTMIHRHEEIKQPYDVTKKKYKEITQWDFVLIELTIKIKIIHQHKYKMNKLKM